MFHQPMRTQPARLGEDTPFTPRLRDLPKPANPYFVAVYKFRDQSGQYKPVENGASWSTPVTQGATNILIRALEESNYLIPVERENISNLITERDLVNRLYNQNPDPEKRGLPYLTLAAIILEGGIVSYDANILTGGAGARYFGAGGSAKYRQDRVSVYLRAVSVKNGRILKTVYTSKTILSQALDAGLFRYVAFQRLLEAETGFTYNEPSELAVTEAIEKAVHTLILEGIRDGLWMPDTSAMQQTQELLAAYESEKKEMQSVDFTGNKIRQYNDGWSVEATGGLSRYRGDLPGSEWQSGAALGLNYHIGPALFLNLQGGIQQIASGRSRYLARQTVAELNIGMRTLPFNRFSPLFYTGIGLVDQTSGEVVTLEKGVEMATTKAQAGLGFSFRLNNRLELISTGGYNYFLQDDIDGFKVGRFNDSYLSARLGMRIYFSKKQKD